MTIKNIFSKIANYNKTLKFFVILFNVLFRLLYYYQLYNFKYETYNIYKFQKMAVSTNPSFLNAC